MTRGNPYSVLGLLLSLVGLAAYAYLQLRNRRGSRQTHGDSRWAGRHDLRALTASANRGRGIVLGWLGRRRLLLAPAEDNVLVFGVQRSGKTSTVVVPTLLVWRGAAVATSTKEELVALTARHRAGIGPVSVFAPLDRDQGWITDMGLTPVTWNPINEVGDAGDAAELADLFTAEGKQSQSAHWYLSAANLLTGLVLLERDSGGDMRSVLRRINDTPVLGYLLLSQAATGDTAEILRAFASTPEREAGSIISTARSALSLWLDPRVARATSSSGRRLDLDALLASSGTLYLVAPAEDAERCRLLFSALLSALLRKATERARRLGGVLEPRLLLALDEAANFARMPRLASYASTGPGQGIQSLLCFHDLAQLEDGYGHSQARTIWNNCRARLLLPGQGDMATLALFSDAIGNETVTYDELSHGGKGGSTTHETRLGIRLVSPDVLRRSARPVLLYADRSPARLTARRWDQVPAWRDAVASARGSPGVRAA